MFGRLVQQYVVDDQGTVYRAACPMYLSASTTHSIAATWYEGNHHCHSRPISHAPRPPAPPPHCPARHPLPPASPLIIQPLPPLPTPLASILTSCCVWMAKCIMVLLLRAALSAPVLFVHTLTGACPP